MMSEGLCNYCLCVYVLANGLLPNHNIGLNPHMCECHGSGKAPTKLVVDNELVEVAKAKEKR